MFGQEGKEAEFIESVKRKINAQIKNAAKYDIRVTKDGVEVKDVRQWVTIFEGEAQTVNSYAQISDECIFIDGYKYKITLDGPKYSGSVETIAQYFQTTSGNMLFALFAIDNNQAIGLTDFENYEIKLGTLSQNAIAAIGMYNETQGSMINFNNTTDTYKITKIEGEVPYNIYEFPTEKIDNAYIIEELSAARNYIIECEIDGKKEYLCNMMSLYFGGPAIACGNSKGGMLVFDGKVMSISDGITPIRIYDIGENPSVVRENGFTLIKKYVNKLIGEVYGTGILSGVPGGTFTIPRKIQNIDVEWLPLEVITDQTAIVTIEHYIKLSHDDLPYINKIIIKKEAEKIIEDYANKFYGDIAYIDISDCGDDVNIPDSWLTSDNSFVVLVTPNAKTNKYAQNANVQAIK